MSRRKSLNFLDLLPILSTAPALVICLVATLTPTDNPDAIVLIDLGACVSVVVVSAVALLTVLATHRYTPKFLAWSNAAILAGSGILTIKLFEQYLTFP